MAEGRERTPYERETLIKQTPEEAGQFREVVREKIAEQPEPTRRDREVVAEVMADEFAEQGVIVGDQLNQPWQHTEAEHVEVQQLVDLAFAQDLKAAIAEARKSEHFPRNLDLLHDVLTSEMYEAMTEHKLNEQPFFTGWTLFALGVTAVALLVTVLLMANV